MISRGTGEKIAGVGGKGRSWGAKASEKRGKRISTGKGGKDLSEEKGEDLRERRP